MRKILSDVLSTLGLVAIVVAGFLFSVIVGFVLLGAALILVAYFLERSD